MAQPIAYESDYPVPPERPSVVLTDSVASKTDIESLVGLLDLTSLNGDDTETSITELCRLALDSVAGTRVAAVCVYPAFVPLALKLLAGQVPVATVAGGFPHGLSPLASRVHEVNTARELGAGEIDVVIRREFALSGHWRELYDEVLAMRLAAGDRHLKVILATGELADHEIIYKAAMVSMAAGADFIKTSTGKESVNATLPAGSTMLQAIDSFHRQTGRRVGLKAAGGIRTVAQAVTWLDLLRSSGTLPDPNTLRIGASALLENLRSAIC